MFFLVCGWLRFRRIPVFALVHSMLYGEHESSARPKAAEMVKAGQWAEKRKRTSAGFVGMRLAAR